MDSGGSPGHCQEIAKMKIISYRRTLGKLGKIDLGRHELIKKYKIGFPGQPIVDMFTIFRHVSGGPPESIKI